MEQVYSIWRDRASLFVDFSSATYSDSMVSKNVSLVFDLYGGQVWDSTVVKQSSFFVSTEAICDFHGKNYYRHSMVWHCSRYPRRSSRKDVCGQEVAGDFKYRDMDCTRLNVDLSAVNLNSYTVLDDLTWSPILRTISWVGLWSSFCFSGDLLPNWIVTLDKLLKQGN